MPTDRIQNPTYSQNLPGVTMGSLGAMDPADEEIFEAAQSIKERTDKFIRQMRTTSKSSASSKNKSTNDDIEKDVLEAARVAGSNKSLSQKQTETRPGEGRNFFNPATFLSLFGIAGAKYNAELEKGEGWLGGKHAKILNEFRASQTLSTTEASSRNTVEKLGEQASKIGKLKFLGGLLKKVAWGVPFFFLFQDYNDACSAKKEHKDEAWTKFWVNTGVLAVGLGLGYLFTGPVLPLVLITASSIAGDWLKGRIEEGGGIEGLIGRKKYNPNIEANDSHDKAKVPSEFYRGSYADLLA